MMQWKKGLGMSKTVKNKEWARDSASRTSFRYSENDTFDPSKILGRVKGEIKAQIKEEVNEGIKKARKGKSNAQLSKELEEEMMMSERALDFIHAARIRAHKRRLDKQYGMEQQQQSTEQSDELNQSPST